MIDYAMLMYGISEREILTQWSIETLVKKVEHGFNFEILKKGGSIKDKEGEEELLTKEEADELEDLYYGKESVK